MIRNLCLILVVFGLVIGDQFNRKSCQTLLLQSERNAMAAAVSRTSFLAPSESLSADDTDSARQPMLRVAIVGFVPATPANKPGELALAEALGADLRIAVIDPSIVQAALVGIGYGGSINMTKDEARQLGGAIGCDFFIVGKAEALTRSEQGNESHEEAYTGVMIVDGRSGALAVFDFISNKAANREAARQAVMKTIETRASGYVDRMIQSREQALNSRSRDSVSSASTDLIEDAPGEDSARAAGFKAPEFLNRAKPEYTSEAEKADITATVEAMVVFRSNGEVGGIEITRWAGFGLEESSERALRQLKFKPGTRGGQPISVRAMIRYNFRRIVEAPGKLDQPDPKPPEKPERDLRQIFKPTYRRP